MGLFDFFRAKDINAELEIFRKTKGAVLLDVREKEEYAEGHIPDSVNVPLSILDSIENKKYSKDTPLFVYCYSGSRSASAVNKLHEMGYGNARDIGGIMYYRNNG